MKAPNPRLIRLVASRYREMQGLLTIVDAGYPLYLGVTMLAAGWMERAGVSDWFAGLLGVPLLVFMVAQFRWLRPRILAHYRSRFGRVEGSDLFFFFRFAVISQGLGWATILADAHLPWLTVLVVFGCLGAWPAWIVCRDWPYRLHWLPVAIVAMMTAAYMSRMPSYSVAIRHQAGWALAVGGVIALAGLFDHLLLVKTLRPGSESKVGERA